MSFIITDLAQNSISHLDTYQPVLAGQAPRGIYFEIEHYNDVCWYIKNHYEDPDLLKGRSSIFLIGKNGDFAGKETLNHLIFRIKRSSVSKRFIALTFNLRLHFYSPNFDTLAIQNISERIASRYHVQCLDLSDNSEFIFYSNWNLIIRLDQNLRTLNTWKIPNRINRHNKAASPAIKQALSILSLSKDPSIDEIKTAFRLNLLRVHPDINRNDPLASEKTRAVIEAYEVLSRGSFNQDNNDTGIPFIQIHLAFEDDSVTATQIRHDTEDLYVGCYSGNLYLLMRSGRSKLVYEGQAPIRRIKEIGNYLYIVYDLFCDILLDGILVSRILGLHNSVKIRFERDYCTGMICGKTVYLYSPGGIAFAEVSFKESIADIFLHNRELRVLTGKKSYVFSIQPPSDYKFFTDKNIYLPS